MWQEKDFLKMMQVNSELYGDEITHISGADDQYLINYFEHRLVKLFPPYSFLGSKYCEAIYEGKGDVKEERLIEGGFGLSVKQCVAIGNHIACRYHIDWLFKTPKLSELDTVVVLNYIEHGYPLDETQYKIVYSPRPANPLNLVEALSEVLRDAFSSIVSASMNDDVEAEQKE